MNSKAVYTTSNTTDTLRYCKYNIELLGKKYMWVGDLLLASRLACFDKLALRSLHSC